MRAFLERLRVLMLAECDRRLAEMARQLKEGAPHPAPRSIKR